MCVQCCFALVVMKWLMIKLEYLNTDSSFIRAIIPSFKLRRLWSYHLFYLIKKRMPAQRWHYYGIRLVIETAASFEIRNGLTRSPAPKGLLLQCLWLWLQFDDPLLRLSSHYLSVIQSNLESA